MEITDFGYILLGILFVSFFLSYKYAVGILVISCVFQTANVIRLDDKVIQPFLICSLFLIIRSFISIPCVLSKLLKDKLSILLMLFMLYAIVVTLFLPFVFNGVTVFEDKNVDDSVVQGGVPLHFNLNNITQIGYISLNSITLLFLWVNKHKVDCKMLRTSFYIAILIVLIIGFWEFLSKTTGAFPYPVNFFRNNAEGMIYEGEAFGVMRMSSLLGEASFCGAFLAASFWASLCMGKKKYYILSAFILLAIIFNLSGTGIMAFILGSLIYVLFKGFHIKVLGTLVFIASLLIIVLFISGYGEFFFDMIFTKSDTGSGMNRMEALLKSLDLILQTYGFGVGMGSHRGSEFLLDLIAQIGVLGAYLFFCIYKKMIYRLKKEHLYLFVYALVLMLAQCLSIPDFSYSPMWMVLFIAASYNKKDLKRHEVDIRATVQSSL